MNTLVKALLIGLFFLVLLGAILFKVLFSSKVSPSGGSVQFPVATDRGVQDQNSAQIRAVQQSFTQQIENADQIKLARGKVVYPYALQDWSDENKGGEALLKYVDGSGWTLVNIGGGAWDVQSLVDQGVPQDIANKLINS